ncbi:GNAT family N-acetyltransferase, partial [Weeksellaceae bacterium KMM 9713]|nr:GNAT family N-acetyltransferase [Profundicola chukchiensis]
MLEITTKSFEELTAAELYKILQLRSEVFVVEQDCVYQDIDGKDDQALHVIGLKNN